VLGACWSRKFWELSAVSEEEWTKGKHVPEKKEDQHDKGKRKQVHQERRKINARNGWIEDQPLWKEVRKWKSEVHLELGFWSHNVRVLTHFVV
jgi:hypothetical protein